MIKDICFTGFTGREEALDMIKRFGEARWDVMFYRTTVLSHSRRIAFLLDNIAAYAKEVYGTCFRASLALILALVHDDAEIVTGDVQLYRKERMTPEQRQAHDAGEIAAIDVLTRRWPDRIASFNYRWLLLAAKEKSCLEAQLVSYLDKLDGMCEALHEVFAGNKRFVGPAENYANVRMPQFPRQYPLLAPIIPGEHPLLRSVPFIDAQKIAQNGKPHTAESVVQPTGISHYDRWKELTIQNAGIEALVVQKEYES